MTDHWIEQSTRNPYVRLVALLGGLLLIGMALYGLRAVLTPVFISFFVAYLLDPVVDRFEARGVNRTVAIIILMVVLFILSGLMLLLIGLAVSELVDVIKNLPAWLDATIREWRSTWQEQPAVVWISETLGWDIRSVNAEYALDAVQSLRERLLGLLPNLVGPLRAILTHALSGTMALVGWVANIVLIPLISFYLLRDFDLIVARVKGLVPKHYVDEVSTIFKQIDESIAAFIRGQLLVMVILGVLYGIGLALFKVKMGFGIGLLAGLLCIVPYLGFFVGIGLALLMSLMGGEYIWLNLIGTVVTFGVVQILEGTFITPKVVGDKVGLHPVWVIIALMVGANALGVLGMLIAIPVAAVIKILLVRAIAKYEKSRLFSREEKSAPSDDESAAEPEAPEPQSAENEEAAAAIFAPSTEGDQLLDDLVSRVENASVSQGIRESVDAAARGAAGDASDDAPIEDAEPSPSPDPADLTQKAKIPFSPSSVVKPGPEEDEEWAKRLGRKQTPQMASPEKKSGKESTKTLPDHPISPQLQEIIDRSTPPDEETGTTESSQGSNTLRGVPVRPKDEQNEDD